MPQVSGQSWGQTALIIFRFGLSNLYPLQVLFNRREVCNAGISNGWAENIHNHTTLTAEAAAQEKQQRAKPTNSYTAIMGHNTLSLAHQQRYAPKVY